MTIEDCKVTKGFLKRIVEMAVEISREYPDRTPEGFAVDFTDVLFELPVLQRQDGTWYVGAPEEATPE